MTDIAAAILSVGLCFYELGLKKNKLDTDLMAAIFATLAALKVLL